MSRDPRKLRVFSFSDALVLEVYRVTAKFPSEERFGLQSQLRRAAISVPVNIVEGCARRTTGEYVHFLNIATGSAAEALYLLDVAERLNLLTREEQARLGIRYTEVLKGLISLTNNLGAEPS
jgi:four helix bundle protein